MADMKLLGFEMSDELKQAYVETYTDEAFKEAHPEGSPLRLVYDNAEPEKQDYIKFLHAFDEETKATGFYDNDGAKNISEIKEGPDHNVRLIMKNLGGTGLNFTIENGKSIVFAPDSELTTAQTKELAKFFHVHGIGTKGVEDFRFPDDVNIKADEQNPNPKNLKDTFADGLAEAQGEDQFSTEENFQEWVNNTLANDPNATVPAKFSSKMSTSMSKMADDCRAKIAISLNMRGKLVKSRRAADGSIIISCYINENDERHDGENNKGDIKRTKACAFKINIKHGIPEISCYIPDGKALETNHVKVMLDTLKAQGAQYFTMPNALVTSGKSQGAFWEAAGKTLMVPLCKTANQPEGSNIEGDHVKSILDSIDKETKGGKHTKTDVLKWKAMMLDELNEQEAYREAKANDPIRKEFDAKLASNPNLLSQYTAEFMALKAEGKTGGMGITDYARSTYVANKPGSYKTNSGLQDQIDAMSSSIKYENFQNKYLGTLTDFIRDGVNGGSRDDRTAPWDFIEVNAASRALSKLCEDYGNPEYKHLSENDGKNDELQKAVLLKELKKRMEIEKEIVAKEIHKSIGESTNNNIRTEVVKSTNTQTQETVKSDLAKIQEKYGADIKFQVFRAAVTSLSENVENKYFDESGRYKNPSTPRIGRDSTNTNTPSQTLTPAQRRMQQNLGRNSA